MDKTHDIVNSVIRIGNVDYSLKRVIDKTAEDIHHLI
jgi:hypothetical protein